LEHIRPFLRWAGGKAQLLPSFEQIWPDSFPRYFEPFIGGGSVFFYFLPKPALLSDLNGDLIDCYRWIQKDVWAVASIFKELEHAYVRGSQRQREELYYSVRTGFSEASPSSLNRAAFLLFLNRTCFNGLWRVNLAGHFNVPHGRIRPNQRSLLESDQLLEAAEALQGVQLRASDYRSILEQAGDGDLVYLDPPYSAMGDDRFHEYQQGGFPLEAQDEMAERAAVRARMGAHIIVSSAADGEIRDIFESKGFIGELVSVRRSINSIGSNRGGHKEMLFYSESVAAIVGSRRIT
jgi:DNA adenine methylase